MAVFAVSSRIGQSMISAIACSCSSSLSSNIASCTDQSSPSVLGNSSEQGPSSQVPATSWYMLSSVRSKTFTSNVMDETRRKRITEHIQYCQAQKSWRQQMHALNHEWRAEHRAKLAVAAAEGSRVKAAAAGLRKKSEADAAVRDRMAVLEEDVRKSQLEYDVTSFRQKSEADAAVKDRMVVLEEDVRKSQLEYDVAAASVGGKSEAAASVRGKSRQHLLEASRKWVSKEDLEDRINLALENPEPFGFTTNLEKTTGPC
eukprot:gene22798-29967_t